VTRGIGPRIVPSVEVVGGAAAVRDVCPAPGRSHRARSSPLHPVNLVQGTGAVEEHKGAAASVHRLGTACGRSGRSPDGEHRPATEDTSGAAERVPLRGGAREAALSLGQPLRWIRGGDGHGSDQTPGLFGPGAPSGAGALRLSIEADHGQATRGVRGKHGLGQSSRASDRGGRSQCEAIVIASAPGPTNLGWLSFWPGGSGNRVVADAAIRSSSPIPKGARLGRTSCVTGDRDAVLRSSNEPQSCSWIVSIAEVDERRVAPRTLE
jgi:hypothetical protein